MNKTVNINLAGVFFHIDEDAFLKLQRYLDAIKRSFTDSQGRSEIIADIEARIAELFTEHLQNDKQVVSSKLIDEVITIMGQPEDYLVDEEIFDDEPQPKQTQRPSKKLFRDTDNSYIGGVSSGLGHYLGIDAVWLRLFWVLLAIGSGGTFIFVYLLFWILVPEAKTTTEKLMMKGEEVNISNIERKIRTGLDNVADTVKNVDYEKYGNKVKSSSKTFFDNLGEILMFCLTLFAKFIGIILMIIGISVLIGLIIALFTVGITDAINIPGMDFLKVASSASVPLWLISILVFFSIAIPFFFLFYLGLKILVNNLKSIGNIAKYSLLGIWVVSILGLVVTGIVQANEMAFEANTTSSKTINIKSGDTLNLAINGNNSYHKYLSYHAYSSGFKLVYDENDQQLIYTTNVQLIVKSTKDSLGYIVVTKNTHGKNYQVAKERAAAIDYDYKLENNQLLLNGYLTTLSKNKYRDQKVEVELYLPEGSILYADKNTSSYHRNNGYYNHILKTNYEAHYLEIITNDIKCLDCEEKELKIDIDVQKDSSGIKIDNQGIKINSENSSIEIDDSGIKGESKNIKVNISDEGVEIKSKQN